MPEDELLSEVYNKSRKAFVEKYPNLESHLPKNFGFGIGFEFREKTLLISPNNQNRVKRGNVFAVITSLKNVNNGKTLTYSMHLGDTVLLNHSNKVKNLTKGVNADFNEIGYDIDDEQ